MELLSELESRVAILLNRIKELSLCNSELMVLNESLKIRQEDLAQKNDQLEDRVINLCTELESFKSSLLQGSSQIEELHQEKALARLIIEDLIKNIETAVVGENPL